MSIHYEKHRSRDFKQRLAGLNTVPTQCFKFFNRAVRWNLFKYTKPCSRDSSVVLWATWSRPGRCVFPHPRKTNQMNGQWAIFLTVPFCLHFYKNSWKIICKWEWNKTWLADLVESDRIRMQNRKKYIMNENIFQGVIH